MVTLIGTDGDDVLYETTANSTLYGICLLYTSDAADE